MDSLAISILPLDDQEEEFTIFKLSASGHFFVGVQKKRASNVLSIYRVASVVSDSHPSDTSENDVMKPVMRFYLHSRAILDVVTLQEGGSEYAIALSECKTMSVFCLSDCTCKRVVHLDQEGRCEHMAVDEERRWILVASDTGTVCCYDFPSLQLRFSLVTGITGSVNSLLFDRNNHDVVIMLNSSGMIVSMHLQQQKVIGSVTIPEETDAVLHCDAEGNAQSGGRDNTQSGGRDNAQSVREGSAQSGMASDGHHREHSREDEPRSSMCWLGDSSYLVLFRGALYTWDSLTARTLFCQYIPCHATNAALRAITRVCVGPSLVLLTYASRRRTPVTRRTEHEQVLLGFPKEQFSEDAESSLPLYHLWTSARRSAAAVHAIAALDHSFYVLHSSAEQRALDIYTVATLPEPLQRESSSFHIKARSSDSFGLSWGVEPDCLNAEQFETGWETGSRKEKEWWECDVCRCARNASATSEPTRACAFGSCYSLAPQKSFDLTALQATATHLLLLPAIPSCALTTPLLFTGNAQGVIELWNLDWMARKWSLSVQDPITFIGATPFAVQMRVAERDAGGDLGEREEQGSFVSLHNSSPSLLSPQGFSFSPSLSSLDESLGLEHSPAPTDSLLSSKEENQSFVDLRELSKSADRRSYSRILVVGTRRGRMLLMEEKEGRVLIDVNVMDAALDRILISNQYAVATNSERVSGFVLTCVNFDSRTFYSLLFTYSRAGEDGASKADSAPRTFSEASVRTPGAVASSLSSTSPVAVTVTVTTATAAATVAAATATAAKNGDARGDARDARGEARDARGEGGAAASDDASSTAMERASLSGESAVTINSLMRVSGESDELSVMNEYFLGLFSLEECTLASVAYEEGETLELLRIVVRTTEGDVRERSRSHE